MYFIRKRINKKIMEIIKVDSKKDGNKKRLQNTINYDIKYTKKKVHIGGIKMRNIKLKKDIKRNNISSISCYNYCTINISRSSNKFKHRKQWNIYKSWKCNRKI